MRRVLVTGAASGLGAALTRAFAERGDAVLATDLGTSYDGPAAAYRTLDVTSGTDWAAARDWVEQEWGRLDVLVNNAGIAGGGRIDVCGLDEWQRLIDVNLLSVVRGAQTFTPVFKRQRSGRIVNVASLAGLVHPAGMAAYNAVKAGVVALSETLSHELATYRVGCSVVCPGYFRSGLVASMEGRDAGLAHVIGRLVADSPTSADDVAAAVLAGLDEGADLIVPDEAARAAYSLKLADRPAYDAVMRDQAAKLDRMPAPGGQEPA